MPSDSAQQIQCVTHIQLIEKRNKGLGDVKVCVCVSTFHYAAKNVPAEPRSADFPRTLEHH